MFKTKPELPEPTVELLQQVVELQRQQVELLKSHLGSAPKMEACATNTKADSMEGTASRGSLQLQNQASHHRDSYQFDAEDLQDIGISQCDGTPQGTEPQSVVPGAAPILVSSVEDDSADEPTITTYPSDASKRQEQDGASEEDDEPTVKRLSTFVLKPTTSSANFDVQIDHILAILPTPIKLYLFSLGLLPADSFSKKQHRYAYRVFRALAASAFFVRIALNMYMLVLRYAVVHSGFPIEVVEGTGMVLAFQLWMVMMTQLERNGHVLLMLYDVTRRGFKWEHAVKGMKRFLATSIGWTFFHIITTARMGFMTQTPCQMAEDKASGLLQTFAGSDICTSAISIYVLTNPACYHVGFGVFWCARLLCQFHKHELMWYAHALAEVLKVDDGQSQLMDQLSAAETSVTARLRQASTTWVKSVIFTLAGFSLMILVLVTYLMSDITKTTEDLLNSVPTLFLLITLLVLCGTPIATVAEVFEYDVLHALNNPLVVKNAQRHFGQQLLSHLHTLGWGFRFGQTVIDLRIIMNIIAALMISIITSVSQAVIQQFKHVS